MKYIRLDFFLAQNGISASREKAKREIISGWVKVNGETVRDPSRKISGEETVVVERPGGEFVSRGGEKLKKAIEFFNIDLSGKICLDIGASTGGFTDCMLKSGASKVYAVDVGYNQLDYSLRIDSRVVVMEKTHARDLKKEMFQEGIDFFTADLSFISILKVLPVIGSIFDSIEGVILIKPQFEADPKEHKKGVVRDAQKHIEILHRVLNGISMLNFIPIDLTFSPIKGPAGNIEFLLYLRKGYGEVSMVSEDLISKVVHEAHEVLK
ncbi:MAG TPA: TlyA family RNA methyltransferase [Spirochaetota bacterium]|jgi:23S rRNA (cytidine1920-2'-O)/16S rRNA (cytidine1409-2'-O)-methyltransferase|nr:TlyA family RNA methyltransferase [Spirochaetota bacterium]